MQAPFKNLELKSTQRPSSTPRPAVDERTGPKGSENEFHASPGPRSAANRPIFVVGCPRSGTTLLYHSILSSGDFALFPREFGTFQVLSAKFPDLTSSRARKKLLEFFVRTKNFTATGLERSEIEPRILRECQNIADFLRIVMEEMCRKQGVRRWAEKTADHAL